MEVEEEWKWELKRLDTTYEELKFPISGIPENRAFRLDTTYEELK